MRRVFKWLGYGLFCLVIAGAAVAFWEREQIERLIAVNSLFEPDRIVENFSNMDRAFLTAPVTTAAPPTSLPAAEPMRMPDGYDNWVADRTITSALVLKNGSIVHEAYYLGTGPKDRRISWSVAKSYLSALLGIVIADGDIESLDIPVTQYAPELKGGAYDQASLRNILNMASGVTFNEDYFDYNSDINRMGRVLALGGKMDNFAAKMNETFAVPGTDWQYTSIDTHVIGMIIRGATGRAIPDLIGEKIIAPLGLEADPYYLTDGNGVAFVLGGLNLTTRDYARFGQMILNGGTWNDQQIVPAEWIAESTSPSAPTDSGAFQYGYQWWMPPDAKPGEFFARGIYGQYMYFDTAANTVIVVTAADRGFREPGINESNIELFRRIAQN